MKSILSAAEEGRLEINVAKISDEDEKILVELGYKVERKILGRISWEDGGEVKEEVPDKFSLERENHNSEREDWG